MKIATYEQQSFLKSMTLPLSAYYSGSPDEDESGTSALFQENILDAPNSTNFYFVIDTTSITTSQQTAIIGALNGLKPLLRDLIFNGDQTKADNQIFLIESNRSNLISSGSEAWVGWFNDLYSANAVYYFWMDETASDYHQNNKQNENYSPTPKFIQDFTTFKNNYSSRNYFVAKVYHVKKNYAVNEAFKEHLLNAFFGNYGHEPMYNYLVEARFDLDSLELTAEDYLNDFLRLINIGIEADDIIGTDANDV